MYDRCLTSPACPARVTTGAALLCTFVFAAGCEQNAPPPASRPSTPIGFPVAPETAPAPTDTQPAATAPTQPVATPPATAPAATGDTTWTPRDEGQLSFLQRGQLGRATLAREQLFNDLFAELSKGMAEKGVAQSIAICRSVAPRIAAAVAQAHGLRIGRTSFRLRNEKNAPPAWAAVAVAERTPGPLYFAGSGGELGVLHPIRLKPQCLMCHGPAEIVLPEVRRQLTELYPDDQAIGFKAGELRGWFWIEVPGPS